MWLPKDERKLLQGYYVTIGEVGEQHEFPLENLMGFIKSSASVHLTPADDPQHAKKYNAWLKDWSRVITANKALEERRLITGSHDNDIFIRTYKEVGPNPRLIFSLTITGYDLGKKYSSQYNTILLWCNEYKIWVILSTIIALAGIIISILVAILKD